MKRTVNSIQFRATHLHFTQGQVLPSSKDNYVNIAAIHSITLEFSSSSGRDACDYSTLVKEAKSLI